MASIISESGSVIGTDGRDIVIDFGRVLAPGVSTMSGGAGNDVLIGDRHRLFADVSAVNTGFATALSLDAMAYWSLDYARDVGSSTSVPWTSVAATAAGGYDYFAVTLEAGQTITLDIDYAQGDYGGPGLDTYVILYGPDRVQVKANDNFGTYDVGSYGADSWLSYAATVAGTYYVRVSQYSDANPNGGSAITAGSSYLLNVSVTGHAVGAPGIADNDVIGGGDGSDIIGGGPGDDILNGNWGEDFLYGGPGDDVLIHIDDSGNSDRLDGGEGFDTYVVGLGSGKTTIVDLAGGGAITVVPTVVNWTIDLQAGTGSSFGATLTIIGEIDEVRTSDGGDLLTAHSRGSILNGGGGNDTLRGGAGPDWLIAGTGARDVLSGGAGHDSVWGGDGDDLLDGGPGDDTITGGAGIDTVSYAGASAAVTIDLAWIEEQDTRGAGWDTLVGIENVIGSGLGDRLSGNALDNVIQGGGGADRLSGGGGHDVFRYLAAGDSTVAAPDEITDFAAGDRIDLSALGRVALAFDGAGTSARVIRIDIGDDGSDDMAIRLSGVDPAHDLSPADFIFAP